MGREAFEMQLSQMIVHSMGHHLCLGQENPWDSAAARMTWKIKLAARKRSACHHQWEAK